MLWVIIFCEASTSPAECRKGLQILCMSLFLINSAVRGWGKIQAEKVGVLPQLWLFRWGRTAWESAKFEVALRCAIIKEIICSVIGATELIRLLLQIRDGSDEPDTCGPGAAPVLGPPIAGLRLVRVPEIARKRLTTKDSFQAQVNTAHQWAFCCSSSSECWWFTLLLNREQRSHQTTFRVCWGRMCSTAGLEASVPGREEQHHQWDF